MVLRSSGAFRLFFLSLFRLVRSIHVSQNVIPLFSSGDLLVQEYFSFGRSIPWVPVSPAANIKGRKSKKTLISMNYLIHRFSLFHAHGSGGYSQKLPTFPQISKFSRKFLGDVHMHCQQIYPGFFLAVWCKPQNGVSGFFILFYGL